MKSLTIAAVALLLGPCTRDAGIARTDETTDAASPLADITPPPPPGDAGDADARAPDAPTADAASPPLPDPTDALRICGLVSACLHGQGYLMPCVYAFAAPLTADQYRANTAGRAVVTLVGDYHWSGAPTTFDPEYGFFPREPFTPAAMLAEPATRACLLAARSCDDAFRCMNTRAASASCAPADGTTRCDGTVLRACLYTDQRITVPSPGREGLDGRQFAVDCASQGNVCQRGGGPDGGAFYYGCSTATCDLLSTAAYCEGNVAVMCRNGHQDRQTCSAGTVCQASGPSAGCAVVGTGAACDTASTPARCDGDNLVECAGGRLRTTACGATTPGTRCVIDPRAGNAYCGLATECSIVDDTTCDGATGTVRTCYFGRTVAVDCHALGFATCGGTFGTEPHCVN